MTRTKAKIEGVAVVLERWDKRPDCILVSIAEDLDDYNLEMLRGSMLDFVREQWPDNPPGVLFVAKGITAARVDRPAPIQWANREDFKNA